MNLDDVQVTVTPYLAVRWLGHATVRIDLGPTRILTDPLLRDHAGLLRRVGPPPAPFRYAGVRALLLSHLHLDHADVGSLRMLSGLPVFTGPANVPWVRKQTHGSVFAPVGWHQVPGTEVEVHLVRAEHHSRRMPHRPNDAHGMLLRSPHGVVWFAGDTALHTEMGGLAALAGRPIDLAILPVGGWGPRLGEGHLGPAEAVEAVRRSGARAVVGIHAATLRPPLLGWGERPSAWMTRPLEEFARLVPERLHGVQHLDLRPGQKGVVHS